MDATSRNDELAQANSNSQDPETGATGDSASEEAHAETRQAMELGKIRAKSEHPDERGDSQEPPVVAAPLPSSEQKKQLEGLQNAEELEKKECSKSSEAFKADEEDVKPSSGSKGADDEETSLTGRPREVVTEPPQNVPSRPDSEPYGPGAHAIGGIGTSGTTNADLVPQPQVSTDNPTREDLIAGVPLPTGVPAEDPQIEAFLVDDPEVPVAEVKPIMPFFQRREGRRTIAVVGVLLSALAILLGVFLTRGNVDQGGDEGQLFAVTSSLEPSDVPSSMPSFDTRSTLAIVQDRDVLNCGVEDTVEGGAAQLGEYTGDLCRQVAAVVLGDPEKVNLVKVGADRFELLHGRDVDLLIAGEESTMAKSVREPTTGEAFAFGYPYYKATVHYIGLQKYVQCAAEQKRFGECKDLSICAYDTSDIRDRMTKFFPGPFVRFGPFPEMEKSLRDGTCNVLLSDTYRILGSSLQEDIDFVSNTRKYVVSDMYISRKQLGPVMRANDVEWRHIVEGTRYWSSRAFHVGFGKDDSSCPAKNGDEFDGSINFFNGVHCVGNWVEIFQRSLGSHVIGVPTIPMIDVVKLGDLNCNDCENILTTDSYLRQIVDAGKLKCGIYLDPLLNITTTSVSTLIAEQFCRAIAVVIFQGKPNAAEITHLEEIDFSEFPEEFDIILGTSWREVASNDEGDLLPRADEWAPNVAYFFHNKFIFNGTKFNGVGKADTFMTSAKRSSKSIAQLVASIFTAIVDAQRRGISRANSKKMPLVEFFGEGLEFMARDVVAFAGNYDDIFEEAYAKSDGLTERGDWNVVLQNSGVDSAKLPTIFCLVNHGMCPPTEYGFEIVPDVYYWDWEY